MEMWKKQKNQKERKGIIKKNEKQKYIYVEEERI